MEQSSSHYLGQLVRSVLLILALCLPSLANAWGLKTHIWLAQKILADVRVSCRLTIANEPLDINKQVCDSILAHPGSFLAGALGPDAYPDLITGQVTTHPGIPGDWQTADWLVHLYAKAPPGPELAFAAGYLVHASSDVFAHTYVNAYAGDIFFLSDERAVERRHFVLEKYIDARLPGYAFNPGDLAPPAEWLRDKLIHNDDAARISDKSGVALHVAAMHGVYRNVNGIIKQLDDLEKDAGKLVAELVVSIIEGETKIATGEVQLKIAREALSANEAKLKTEQGLYDAANAALQDALEALQDNQAVIDAAALDAQAARAAAQAANVVGSQVNDAITNAENELTNLRNRLVNTPADITRQACHNETVTNGVCDWVCPGGPLNPLCGNSCRDTVKQVCNAVTVVNEVYTGLTGQIANAERVIDDARSRGRQAAMEAATYVATEASKLQQKATAETLKAALELAQHAAQAEHDLRQAQLNVELEATRKSRTEVDQLMATLETLREKLIDANSIKETLAELISRSDVLAGLAKNWRHGMNVAGTEFILASNLVARDMLDDESTFSANYLNWYKCYGNVYGGTPVQLGQSTCSYYDFMAQMDEEVNKIVEKTLPPPFGDLYGRFVRLKLDIKEELKKEASNAALALAKLVAPDPTTADFIDLLARPEHATKDKLNEVFATTEGSNGTPLLTFAGVAELIDADVGMVNDRIRPDRFRALKNALTLSMLALADISGIKGLVWALGANPDLVATPASPGRTSLLFDMVRSIDGNHQWQPYGLPYASAGGAAVRPEDVSTRRYGFGPQQERPGFSLFVNPALRRNVFLRIFDGPINGSLAGQLLAYPFPECERNPFPVSFNDDGSAAPEDKGCESSTIAAPATARTEVLRSQKTRLQRNPYSR